MKYAKLFNKKATPQSQPIPGSGQIPNSAGGHAWAIDRWNLLDRFLILGSENGTYYIDEQKLTLENAQNLIACLKEDGERTVARIVTISHSGRAPKNDPAIFALALCASFGDDKARACAFSALPRVCRTGTHLFAFASACDGLRGWGRGLRKAVGNWYNGLDPKGLEYQAIKYQKRDGWSHRDLLRLAHPKPKTDEHKTVFKWVVDDELIGALPLVEASRQLAEVSVADAAKLIRDLRIPREAVPTELLNDPLVWEALLQDMPMTAMVRNLATMTRVGLLMPGSEATKKVVNELRNEEKLRKARVHPVALLMALKTYASGRGFKGSNVWTPVGQIIDALDEAFYKAFEFVEPTGSRFLLGVDVSSSMRAASVAGSPMTAAEAATAMAMVTIAIEEVCTPMAFSDVLKPLPLSKRMRLDDAVKLGKGITFGGTDCALPMLYAAKHKLPVDAFVVYTDSETWYGSIHPSQALKMYRERMGIAAKLVVVGIVSNRYTIADPNDAGMLDVVGFDTTVPEAIAQFVKI